MAMRRIAETWRAFFPEKVEPIYEPTPETPEMQERQVWKALCTECGIIAEGTESVVRHDGQTHREETGHYVWLCFDLLGFGVGWL